MRYVYYVYLIISATALLVLDNFFNIFRQTYSWWLVPTLLLGAFLLLIILQLIVLFLMILFTDLKKPPERGAKIFRFLIINSLPVMIKAARVKIKKIGFEKELPQNTRMQFVCNHQHDYDPIIILAAFPAAEIAFIGKKEIYETMPIVAKAMHRLYSLPIDRENNREAAKTIIKASKFLKEDKVSIAIFPEGYVSKTCELLPFRNGSFKIAVKANVPIVVSAINNTNTIPKNMFRRKTEVEIRLVDVILPQQYEGMNTSQIGDIVYEKMNSALKDMRK